MSSVSNKKNITYDVVALFSLSSIISYNLYYICRFCNKFNQNVYAFQLTHIAAWYMFVMVLIDTIAEFYKAKENINLRGAHFSNAVSFSFTLSCLVDLLYWVKIYSSSSLRGTNSWLDALLMHGFITVVFILWILLKKQTPCHYRFSDHYSYTPFRNKPLKNISLQVLIPISIITVLYMGWTAFGQWAAVGDKGIYTNNIDWMNHLSSTAITFAIAFVVLLFFVVLYNNFTVIFNCLGARGSIRNHDNLNPDTQYRY